MGKRALLPGQTCIPVTFSLPPPLRDYVDDVARKENRARSWVARRAFAALRRERHDVGDLLQPLLFTAGELKIGALSADEAAATIERQVARIAATLRGEQK